MSPAAIGAIVFMLTFGGALLGMQLRRVLPESHFDAASRDTIHVGIGLIATMTALVLGLVTASAKGAFDAMDEAVKESAVSALALDRTLARYGPETREIRAGLQHALAARIENIWPATSSEPGSLDALAPGATESGEHLADAIRALEPGDDSKRALKAQAVELSEALLRARWLRVAASESSVPGPFLTILMFWLTITFASFGLFAPRNGTVLTVLFVCAVSVGSAVFLVLEMDGPFQGMLRVSDDPMRYTLSRLNQ